VSISFLFKKMALLALGSFIGDFDNNEELKKFSFLSLIFFLIIGIYWVLRPLKDSIFFALIGQEHLWKAKIVSIVVLSPFIVLYGKLVDAYDYHKLFYGFIVFYTIGFLLFMGLFMHPDMGLLNTIKNADRLLAWSWYVFVDSFGAIVVALFWAFTTDISAPESARRGFPLISLSGQLGNIVGPAFITAKGLGFSTSGPIVGICAFFVASIGIVFWIFMRNVSERELIGYQPITVAASATPDLLDINSQKEVGQKLVVQEKKITGNEKVITKDAGAGFFEGLTLLLKEKYLLSLFFMIMILEIIMTVFDYHFKQLIGLSFPQEVDAAAYLASYAQYVGIVSTAAVFCGVQNIQRYLGIKASLLALPLFVFIGLISIYTHFSLLSVIFFVMVIAKSLNYALSQPAMKQLYIPTTTTVKYKVQAWLEVFGSRGSKSLGAVVNGLRGVFELSFFIGIFTICSMGFVGLWILAALYVAQVYEQAIKENRVIC